MTFVHGQWNAVCARCGGEYKARQLKKEWNGLRTCFGGGTKNCWEPKHPQLSVRGKVDRQAPPWVRPEAPDVDISVGSGNEITRDDL